ncbi:MAG TPA: carboxymuconolactone decarboxylase family protein [Holophagaceae bacterium]|nr:carboxymuconolactone decarboxylase family protein [Holophagaceae bacterium]
MGTSPEAGPATDEVLFGDVWERLGLSKRDRSLATVSALIALNRPEQLRFHLGFALKNGVTEAEVVELVTHLAFYAGWPSAMTAILLAKELAAQDPAPDAR